MESKRWFYKVVLKDNRGVRQAEEVMSGHYFRNVRVVEAGVQAVGPVAYGQFVETEDDDVDSQDEAVSNNSDVADYTRQARPFPGDRAPKVTLPRARKISDAQREQAMLLGMEFGVEAYNDAMGWS